MKKNHFIYVMVASIMLLIAACSDENQLSGNILSDEIISLTTGQKEQILAYAKEVIIPNVESKRELAETRGTTVTTPENETAAWGLRRRFIYPLLNCYPDRPYNCFDDIIITPCASSGACDAGLIEIWEGTDIGSELKQIVEMGKLNFETQENENGSFLLYTNPQDETSQMVIPLIK